MGFHSPSTLIQDSVNGNESSASAISTSFTAANTPGNFLIVSGTIARPAGTLSISDTAGNTYSPVTMPVTDANLDVTSYLWYVPVCKGGVNTVTLTPASAGALEIHVSEWSGVFTTYPVDAFASATGTGANASGGFVTTTANGELIYGYTFLLNTATAGSGFGGMTLVNGDLDEYQIQSSAGSVARRTLSRVERGSRAWQRFGRARQPWESSREALLRRQVAVVRRLS